jgi:hypothetical protein
VVLAVEDVANGRCETVFVDEIAATSLFRPPVVSTSACWSVSLGEITTTSLQLVRFPGAPGLVTPFLRPRNGGPLIIADLISSNEPQA